MRRSYEGLPVVVALGFVLGAMAFVFVWMIDLPAPQFPQEISQSRRNVATLPSKTAPQTQVQPTTYSVGVAQIDITPDFPVLLGGFGNRKTEFEGVNLPITAKALAISQGRDEEPVVLITVENLGIPASMTDAVAQRLASKTNLKRSRLAITSTHSHSSPMVLGVTPLLFGAPISDEYLQHIERYTAELTTKLEQVALNALNDRQLARLSWGIGSVSFAVNRRTKGGPVDHDLSLLAVRNLDGGLRAIYVNYACHCVTLSSNKISGDWAGYAQDLIQRDFPSTIAMVSIGCGADQNPSTAVTGDKTDIAMKQATEIGVEVRRLLSGFLAPVRGEISANWTSNTLAFADPPSRAQWEEKAKKQDATGYHARLQLERLDRGEAVPTTLNYPIASWTFGDSLAMVFLPGEVVVDYSLRLKKELDGRRLWINAYANDVPCYIPSERVLKEGGYEAANAMVYYDRPGPLKEGLEAQIVGVVHQQLDARFLPPFDPNKTNGSMPKSPQQSLAMLQTTPNLRVDLVVSEPLISDPVAIDFGLDGGLWVAEMRDYPMGFPRHSSNATPEHAEDAYGPGGRIRLVRDRDGDGQFDSSTVFLDDISFPTGVTVWRSGVLICAAPDILYAEDTNGDDVADVVKTLYSGFRDSNIQARVNSLVYGLDGWIYGSCGLAGGTITNFKGEKFELGDRDFRIKPATGQIEAATGRTQQGRVRDDFGNWFGCDNLNMAFHYPLAEHYLKRNPYIASPPSRVNITPTEDSRRLFPARADAQRFQLSGAPGTVTAACGIGVYRDSKLGPEYTDNLFVCEPVNLLVHRMILKPSGSSFIAERPANELRTEFLRSSDSWFRPVQAVTGPDGGLWVVDMYRYMIEDPRWIPESELAPLDIRAGTSLGRIYRVRNAAVKTPPATRFLLANTEGQPSGGPATPSPVYRELELQRLAPQTELLEASTEDAIPRSQISTTESPDPISRIDRYRYLAVTGNLTADDILRALNDSDPHVKIFGLTLAEDRLPKSNLVPAIVDASRDANPHVRLQAAFSLGFWEIEGTGPLLAKMALKDADDQYLVTAVFSSISQKNLSAFTATMFGELQGREPPSSLITPFLATAVGYNDNAAIKLALDTLAVKGEDLPKAWQLNAVASLVASLSQRSKSQPVDQTVQVVIRRMEEAARSLLVAENLDEGVRMAAINLLGRDPARQKSDAEIISQLLSSNHSPTIQIAAVGALERIAADDTPETLVERFKDLSPFVQPRVVDALLNRDSWTAWLFDGIEHKKIPTTALTAEQRQEVVGHADASIRNRATKLLASSFNSDRAQVIQQYHEVLELKGDSVKGRAIFTKICAQCHRLGDLGHAVGPNLAMVANKTPAFLLQEMLDPNRNVDARYTTFTAVTKSGLSRTGILSSESSTSVTLLSSEEKKFTLLRQDLDELRATGKSLMPEGLEKDLPPQAVADVISFLTSVSAISKTFPGNTPATVNVVDGRLALLATTASIIGDQITFEPAFKNIGYWRSLRDHVFWTVDLTEAAVFDVYMEYACDADSSGNGYLFEAGTSSLSGHVESTGGWDQYKLSRLGTVALGAGSHKIVLRPDGAAMRGALFDLRSVQLVPAGEKLVLATPRVESAATGTQDAKSIARVILDDALSEEKSEAIVVEHPLMATELIVAMTVDMPDDLKEEYRRIPRIWQVAVACGKRNQIDQMRLMMEVSLPRLGQPLKDWQAVVVGGGIINGIGLKGGWPRARIDEILREQPELTQRWQLTLDLAAQMAEDEKINTGTRYDAMRIIALDDRPSRRDLLLKYLPKGTHDELQMGAISGLSDIDSAKVPRLLIENVAHFNEENRSLAIDALIRFDSRAVALLDALAAGRVNVALLNAAQRKALLESNNSFIKERAMKVLGQ